MESNKPDRNLDKLQKLVRDLERFVGGDAQPDITEETIEELQTTLEELQVADEELRQQNEELAILRDAAEAEQRRYQELFESAPDGYLVLDTTGVICEANSAAARLLNVPQESLVGKPLIVFLGKEHKRDFPVRLALLQRAGRIENWEVTMQPRGGEPFYASMTITDFRAPKGKPASLRIQFRDITQRKQAEEALRESEERARLQLSEIEAIYNSAHVGLCVFDRDLRYVRINELLAEMNGVPASEHIGKTPREVIPDLASLVEQVAVKIFRTGEPAFNVEFSGTTPSQPGVQRYWLEHWLPLKNAAGEVDGISVVVEEITERKRMEEELKKHRDRLEEEVSDRTAELNSTVGELDSQIAEGHRKDQEIQSLSARLLEAQEQERAAIARDIHDIIGGRLSAIKFGLEDKLEEMGESAPSRQESLEEVVSVVQSTIEETRRISANLRPPVLDQLGLIAAISWLCREFEKAYDHLRIEKDIGVEEKEIPERVKTPAFRIIQEAFNNVAKHSEATCVRVSVQKKDNGLQVLVEDDGKGFDQRKGHSASRTGVAGMVERARLSGGELLIRSGVGNGTTVMATWPVE